MTIEQMVHYIKIIEMMQLVGIPTTRHKIAKCITLPKSRSTVYRDLRKMYNQGLVYGGYDAKKDKTYLHPTEKGVKLKLALREIL